MPVVLDTNIFISAVISTNGSSAMLLRAASDGRLDVVVSPLLLKEIRDVLNRPRFRRYLSTDEVDEYLNELGRICRLEDDPAQQGPVLRDRSDDFLVHLARECRVDYLVSGDKDLTEEELLSTPTLTPSEAVERLGFG